MQQNCEELLAEQAALVAEARQRVGSSTRVWVYRNLVKVRESDGGAVGAGAVCTATHTRPPHLSCSRLNPHSTGPPVVHPRPGGDDCASHGGRVVPPLQGGRLPPKRHVERARVRQQLQPAAVLHALPRPGEGFTPHDRARGTVRR
jgi:hypothetical protein